MALNEQVLDVFIQPQNQQSPDTSAPRGRLLYAENSRVERFQGQGEQAHLRISKRNGFKQLTRDIRDIFDPSDTSVGFPRAPTLFDSRDSELLALSGSLPHVLAEDSPAWTRLSTYHSAASITDNNKIYTTSGQIGQPDSAEIDGVFAHCWRNLTDGLESFWLFFVDRDGTPIRGPYTALNGVKQARLVSDDTYFWLTYITGGELKVAIYSRDAVLIDTRTIYEFNEGEPEQHDTQLTSAGVAVAYLAGTSLQYVKLSVVANVINWTDTALTTYNSPIGVQFVQNYHDSFAYLLVCDRALVGWLIEYGLKVNVAGLGVISQQWTLYAGDQNSSTGHDGTVCQMSGYRDSGGLCAYLSFWGTSGFGASHSKGGTVHVNALDSGAVQVFTVATRQFITASRAFLLDGRPSLLLWYPSVLSVVFGGTPRSGQPTYFIVDGQSQRILGRVSYGSAGQEWQQHGYTNPSSGQDAHSEGWFHSPSPFVSGGVTHIPVGYNAFNVNETIATGSDITPTFTSLTNAVGLQDIRISGDGRAVEFGGSLLLPGTIAGDFQGWSVSEQGINLAPELPVNITTSNTSEGQLTNGVAYTYQLVWESTSPSGKRTRSRASIPFTVTMGPSDDTVTMDILPITATQRYPDPTSLTSSITIGVYRNYYVGGVASAQLRKVSDDLSPVYSDSFPVTITFVDTKSDGDAQIGEILYEGSLGQGMLPRDPCPAFSAGCVFGDRVLVAGYDGAIWYSAEPVEGDDTWFNSDVMRIPMPTTETVRSLIPLDGWVVIVCDGSIWRLPGSGFSNPTGTSVSVESPSLLPFTNGGTGHYALTTDGALYTSSAGGIYGISRGLDNGQFSQPITNDLIGRTIAGLVSDGKQRITLLLVGTEELPSYADQYDQVSSTWCRQVTPSRPALQAQKNGVYHYCDSDSAWYLTDDTFVDTNEDDEVLPYSMSVQTDWIDLGSVKGFARCWAYLVSGEYRGESACNVSVDADENGRIVTTNYTFNPTAGVPFQYELFPGAEEASRIRFLFSDAMTGGDSFALDLISLTVGIGRGLTRLGAPQRIGASLSPITVEITGVTLDAGLVLTLNGGQRTEVVAAATSVTFPVGLQPGASYRLAVTSTPSGQSVTPVVTNGVVVPGTNTLTLTVS